MADELRSKIVDELDCEYTFGHVTKKKRLDKGIKKSHTNDAFVIAGGNGKGMQFEMFNKIIYTTSNKY